MADAWITVREGAPDTAPVTTTTGVSIGQQVTVGRAGHVVVGVDVPDSGISRIVATITAMPQGWTIKDTSRNGIIIHPWGLAPLRATTDVRLHWPLIGLRVLGAEPDARHWLLLECDRYAIDAADLKQAVGTTLQADPPRPLTPAEQQAVATVFEAILAWPPSLIPGRATATQAGRPSTRHQRLRSQGQARGSARKSRAPRTRPARRRHRPGLPERSRRRRLRTSTYEAMRPASFVPAGRRSELTIIALRSCRFWCVERFRSASH